MAIARTVAEAQVGDLLWLTQRYNRSQGPELVTVLKVARVYVTAGNPKWPRSAQEYRIDNGAIRTREGFSATCYLAGWKDRQEEFWLSKASEMGRAIRWSKDVEILKAVAFALGVDGPPDYSKPPEGEKPR